MASKFISEFTRSPGLQVHLQIRSIAASKCISEFTRSQSPSASPNTLAHGLEVHLHGMMAVIWRYRGNRVGQSDREYTFGRPRSRLTSSHFHLLLSLNEITLAFPTFGLTWSLRDFLDGHNCVDSQCRVGSYLLARWVRFSNKNRSYEFRLNVAWAAAECWWWASLPSNSIVAPQWPLSGASLSSLNRHVRCSSDDARVPSVARLIICIYRERLR